MPANLPPEYIEVEEKYRNANSDAEKLEYLQEMLSLLPKHKGTDKIEADIRRRISNLKKGKTKKKGPTRAKTPDQIEPEGAGQVVLTGLPNSGKSSLVDVLTNAVPNVADFPYSSFDPVVGMMRYEDVQIQLIDTPPLSREHVETWVFNLIRKADLVLILVDSSDDPEKGLAEVMDILNGEGIFLFDPKENFQHDAIGRTNRKGLIVFSKNDEVEKQNPVNEKVALPHLSVSILDGDTLSEFRGSVFDALNIIRIYTKKPGEKPDLEEPYILEKGSTVMDAARSIHRDLAQELDYIRIWGSGKYDGQQVAQDHVLEDGDVIEIHMK